MSSPKLKNIVVLFRVPQDQRERLSRAGLEKKKYDASRRNFYVLKHARHSSAESWAEGRGSRRRRHTLSFIVFPTSGSVIATGVRSPIDAISALALFSSLTGVERPSTWSRRVVNSTYVGDIACCQPPISAHRSLSCYKRTQEEEEEEVNISFRPQFFPGGLIRWRAAKHGSVNLFNNGKYVIVGVRKEKEAVWLCQKLSALIKTHWTTTRPRTSCAWTAG